MPDEVHHDFDETVVLYAYVNYVQSNSVHHDFDETVVALFPDKDIWITEIGYQSGHKYYRSTETKQVHFSPN